MAKNTGEGYRKGSVCDRTQIQNPRVGNRRKRCAYSGKFIGIKKRWRCGQERCQGRGRPTPIIPIMSYFTSLNTKISRIINIIHRKKYYIELIFLFVLIFVLLFIIGFSERINAIEEFLYCAFTVIALYALFLLKLKKIFEIMSFLIGTYLILFTISWAKYEFSVDRENQMLTILTALMTTENRKNFSYLISNMTEQKIEKRPNILSFKDIVYTAIDKQNKVDSENAKKMIASMLMSYKDWTNSNLMGLNVSRAHLNNIYFAGSELIGANFEKSVLTEIDFKNAKLYNSKFKGAIINNCNFDGADIRNSSFTGARIVNTSFKKTKLVSAHFFNAKFKGVNFEDADLMYSSFDEKRSFSIYGFVKKSAKDESIENFLRNVKTLYGATLPEHIEKKLREECPNLFIEPNEKKHH